MAAEKGFSLTDSKVLTGLSEDEAATRLRRDGYNEIASAGGHGVLALVGEVLREPMILLLLGAGTTYLLLGDVREAIVLLFSVFVVIGISLYQNRRTERALAARAGVSAAGSPGATSRGATSCSSPKATASPRTRPFSRPRISRRTSRS